MQFQSLIGILDDIDLASDLQAYALIYPFQSLIGILDDIDLLLSSWRAEYQTFQSLIGILDDIDFQPQGNLPGHQGFSFQSLIGILDDIDLGPVLPSSKFI